MKNKKRNILVGLGIIILIAIAIVLFFGKNKKRGETPTPSGQSSTSVPTPKGVEMYKGFVQEIYPNPQTEVLAFGGTNNAISVFFEEEVDSESGTIESNPALSFTRSVIPDFPNRIIFQPKEEWKTGTVYTVKIMGIRSKDGTKYMKETTLEFSITKPDLPNVDGPV